MAGIGSVGNHLPVVYGARSLEPRDGSLREFGSREVGPTADGSSAVGASATITGASGGDIVRDGGPNQRASDIIGGENGRAGAVADARRLASEATRRNANETGDRGSGGDQRERGSSGAGRALVAIDPATFETPSFEGAVAFTPDPALFRKAIQAYHNADRGPESGPLLTDVKI